MRTALRMNYCATTIAILPLLSASLALAEDFKTVSGRVYKDATISRVETDGIVLKTKTGISKVYFVELPKTFRNAFITAARRHLERQSRNGSTSPKAPSPPPRSSMARMPPISLRNEFQKSSTSGKRYHRGNTHPARQRR
jgi:hypothetical protein